MAETIGAASSLSLGERMVRMQGYQGLRSVGFAAMPRPVRALPSPCSSSSSVVTAVSTPVKPDPTQVKRSKVEIFKEHSNFLRYPLKEELETEAANINEAATQLIKFHGSYQQTNRDEQPSGKVPNRLYLVMDDLADEFGIGTLRLTTRQTFQLHGITKFNLKTVLGTIIRNMGSTLGACGDLNRNVLAPAAPLMRKDYLFAQETADNIAMLLSPQSGSYYDIWVDGEKIMSAEPPEVVKARNDNSNGTNFPDSPEPIYGTQFLPRKFKIAVTVPTDNSVDILTNDVGVVVVSDADGEPQGFNIYVRWGDGKNPQMEATFPRLGDQLGYVPKEDILYAIKAIVVTQREHGRRDDRRYSRMKYLISDWGIDKFRGTVERYYGKKFEPFRELPEWEFKSYLGWHEQGDGAMFCGLHVDNGPSPLRGSLNITAMACPALPLCPLAIAEAERGIPDILKRVRAVFDKVGLKYSESVVIRVTGCPNGCAGLTWPSLDWSIWLGGTPNQMRLAETFMNKVKLHDLETVLEPLFYNWKIRRLRRESFGDFSMRIGFEKLRDLVEKWEGPAEARPRFGLKLFSDKETYEAMSEIAQTQNKTAHQLAMEVIRSYVASNKLAPESE
ncbi:unnamed protein product [Spirodela intermedia]|uniref:assimilatory sulfite reductase (ferredoxin) n=1 Tax=Spirodela intermedia TaxID=51605 RepID=A0A7I8I9M8_SPIIN|nr:unnamed protein product [Spirodela intermedia]CAA6653631.1 unnamed protein product [Spirodela intermedia]